MTWLLLARRWFAGNWRLIVLAVVITALCLALGVVDRWRRDAAALPDARRTAADAQAMLVGYARDVQQELIRRNNLEESLRHEADQLRAARDVIPVRPVRLCPADETGSRASGATSAGGDGTAAAAPGQLPQAPGPGPDIGPALYALSDEADELVRSYRGLQQWVAGLPAACRGITSTP